jgi:hypothetical protein
VEGKESILAFGSGSVSPQRDSLLIVDVNEPLLQKWVSLKSLYEKLRKLSATNEINLEGAVISGDKLYLFNRSGNQVYIIGMNDFFPHISTGNQDVVNTIKVHQLTLPSSNGVQSSLSGGCLMENGSILFSASVEDTPNSYDDGGIGGSFIGIIEWHRKPVIKQMALLKDKQDSVLKDKLESVDIIGKYSNGDIKALAVADNDDCRSKLFELRIAVR